MKTVIVTMFARLPPARFMIWSICENTCFTCASKLLAMSLPSLSRVAVWPATQTILPPSVTTPGENARDNWNGVFSMYSAAVAAIGSEAIAASRIWGNVGMRSIAFSRANGVDGTRAQVTEARAKATLAQTIVENKRAAVSCAGAVAGEPCFGSASMLRSTQKPPVMQPDRGSRMNASGALRRAATAALLACSALAAAGALAQARIVLRISTPAVPGDWHVKMLYVFKDELAKAAPGRFDVQVHHSGTLFRQGAEAVAMQRGNLEMALVSMQDIARQMPEYSIFTAGYLIRDPDHLAKVYGGAIGAEVSRRIAEAMGIQLLQAVYLGTRQVSLAQPRPVRTPADLAGVKLRMPGSKEWLFLGQALGASPTPLAFTEVYLGLKTGTIDGQDNPLPTLKSAKFYEVTRQIVLTGHLVDVLQLAMSAKTWNALSAAHRAQVKRAAAKAAKFNDENRAREERELVEFFRSQGIEITTPDVEAFRKTVQAAYLKSEFAQKWPRGLLERINAVK